MVKDAERSLVMINRAHMYNFLKRLYRSEVDQGLLSQMQTTDFPKGTNVDELNEGYHMLENYLVEVDHDTLDELAVDYARIFLSAGIAAGKAAFPYESVYTSQKNIMMQEARDQVRAIYCGEGLLASEGQWHLPEDHISYEFEFMAYLCQEGAGKLENQETFLSQHLLNWLPAFCKDVETYASTNFYKALSKITIGYLKLDQLMIESMMD